MKGFTWMSAPSLHQSFLPEACMNCWHLPLSCIQIHVRQGVLPPIDVSLLRYADTDVDTRGQIMQSLTDLRNWINSHSKAEKGSVSFQR